MNFESCELIRELPDLSGAPGLSELYLQDCKNLTKIHHSIGFLDIRSLYLQGCGKLKIFTQMELKSLDLSGCSNLQTYPKISLKMKNIREANLLRTIVQELLKSCSDFQSFSVSKGQQGRPTLSSSLTHLDLSQCNLSDQVLVYLVCFPNLQNLNLGGNNFTILPACIKECSHLSYLSLDNCKNLQKIEGIPPNIELLRATNCMSLTPISSSMLLSQVPPSCSCLCQLSSIVFVRPCLLTLSINLCFSIHVMLLTGTPRGRKHPVYSAWIKNA